MKPKKCNILKSEKGLLLSVHVQKKDITVSPLFFQCFKVKQF